MLRTESLKADQRRDIPRDIEADEELSCLLHRFVECRSRTLDLTEGLSAEDQVVQVNSDASPTKWHLAHTTWFFESFILRDYFPEYRIFSDAFEFCFNSYYESKGSRLAREQRGLLTRPSLEEVLQYRDYVDRAVITAFRSDRVHPKCRYLLEVGIQHEQQHQELLLTDILALFAAQPLKPAYNPKPVSRMLDDIQILPQGSASCPMIECGGEVVLIGHKAADDFCFDNEMPAHRSLVLPFKIAEQLTTNAQWIEFIEDGGYANARLWLSEGWDWVNRNGISSPGYMQWDDDGGWQQMTLSGMRPVALYSPVCHISFYEADAFAKWSGKRLPTEFEWERALDSTARQVR